ncbi:hypothetical protein [Roseibacillus ishigakijimensis]|uniref:Uncharacterized protein n=1 Tax=Roseibacillus ishigakijimensis TaxID=454146 RepID=A0A934RPP4_9BACT|nr:hypothetical protein [Roseibacillus ishigakijimensis]MBK1833203.1 hypothetical protein [Roseibacillus ishigakijimensis]
MSPTTRFLVSHVFIALVVNFSILSDLIRFDNTALCEEGSFVEDISFFSFLAGAFVFFSASFHREGFARFGARALAVAYLAFFLREVDVADHNVPFPLKQLGSNLLKDTLVGLAALAFGFVFLRRYRDRIPALLASHRLLFTRLLLLGSALFVIASGFEQRDLMVVEEILETNAAFAFFVASLLFSQSDPLR